MKKVKEFFYMGERYSVEIDITKNSEMIYLIYGDEDAHFHGKLSGFIDDNKEISILHALSGRDYGRFSHPEIVEKLNKIIVDEIKENKLCNYKIVDGKVIKKGNLNSYSLGDTVCLMLSNGMKIKGKLLDKDLNDRIYKISEVRTIHDPMTDYMRWMLRRPWFPPHRGDMVQESNQMTHSFMPEACDEDGKFEINMDNVIAIAKAK